MSDCDAGFRTQCTTQIGKWSQSDQRWQGRRPQFWDMEDLSIRKPWPFRPFGLAGPEIPFSDRLNYEREKSTQDFLLYKCRLQQIQFRGNNCHWKGSYNGILCILSNSLVKSFYKIYCIRIQSNKISIFKGLSKLRGFSLGAREPELQKSFGKSFCYSSSSSWIRPLSPAAAAAAADLERERVKSNWRKLTPIQKELTIPSFLLVNNFWFNGVGQLAWRTFSKCGSVWLSSPLWSGSLWSLKEWHFLKLGAATVLP